MLQVPLAIECQLVRLRRLDFFAVTQAVWNILLEIRFTPTLLAFSKALKT